MLEAVSAVDPILLQEGGGAGLLAGLGILLFLIVLVVFLIVGLLPLIGMAKVFSKAGKPWWAAIVPIYNVLVLIDIVDGPIWYLVLFFFPPLNILVFIDLAEEFGKGTGFAAGMTFLPFVFVPLLGFGSAQYRGGGRPSSRSESY